MKQPSRQQTEQDGAAPLTIEHQVSDLEGSSVSQSRNVGRRRFAKAGIAAPVVLMMSNRSAFGAVCTVSGFVSFSPNNPSGVRHQVTGCGGWSPGAWKNPDAGNGDGSRKDWKKAGYFPNPRPNQLSDPAGTPFHLAFGLSDNGWGSMHDVLLNRPGSLEFHATATLLNAAYRQNMGIPGYMPPSDVIGLYQAYVSHAANYTTSSGSVVPLDNLDLKYFFEQTYH